MAEDNKQQVDKIEQQIAELKAKEEALKSGKPADQTLDKPAVSKLNDAEQAMCAEADKFGFKYFAVGDGVQPVYANSEHECEADKKKLNATKVANLKVYIKKQSGWSEVL